MAQELITTREACIRLGVSRRTIVRAIAAGTLTFTQKLPGLRGAYLFSRDDLDRFRATRAAA